MTTTSGYVPIGDLRMYFEVHGDERAGSPPLLLLHGGLFDIDQQFARSSSASVIPNACAS